MANYIIIGGDGKEYGPVTEADVRQWIAEGRLNGESLVKAESDAEYRRLALFPELATLLKATTAPGVIAPVSSSAGGDSEAEILAREPELRFGECLAAGWGFLGKNAGFLAAAAFLAWVANLVVVVASITIPIIGPMILGCLHGVIMGGFYLACLRRLRGEAASPAEVFSGFTVAFGQLLLAGLVISLLTGVAFCCFVLPAIYLMVAWSFSVPLVADKRMFFWSAMELSRKVVTRIWFEVLLLLVITFLPMLIFNFVTAAFSAHFFLDLWHQSGGNWQQLAQILQTQSADLQKLTIRSTLIGQAVFLLNLFYSAGVIVRAYENLFGPKKP
jgi:hypothetical protein